MKRRRVRLLLMLAAVMPAGGAVLAGDQAADPGTDAELLEFLGSVDSGADAQTAADDGSWIDYLSQTDINKVAARGDPNRAPPQGSKAPGSQPPARPPPPPPSGDKND